MQRLMVIAAALLLAGCGVAPSGGAGGGSSEAGGGEEAGEAGSQGIPQGLYVGDLSCTDTLTVLGESESESESNSYVEVNISREYGPSGIQLTASGTPIEAGDGSDSAFGPSFGTSVVVSVGVGENRLVVGFDEIATIVRPDGTAVNLIGSSQETHEFIPPRTVLLSISLAFASGIIDGELLTYEHECSGRLTK